MSIVIEEAINKIKNKIEFEGYPYPSWYIGIANDIKKKLFEHHNVNDQNGKWIYITVPSNSDAKEIKKYFEERLVSIDNEDDDDNGLIVFAYKINTATKQ